MWVLNKLCIEYMWCSNSKRLYLVGILVCTISFWFTADVRKAYKDRILNNMSSYPHVSVIRIKYQTNNCSWKFTLII